MTKKIALFSDGTGNSSAKAHKTNVWRAYKALDLSPDSNQVAFYDDGVGTSSNRLLAILGGVLGAGLARNVRQIYRFVCLSYEKDAEIYGFGFSRGAFTMRVVAAFIADQGIIDHTKTNGERDLDRLIKQAYRQFRRENFGRHGFARILTPPGRFLIWAKDRLLGNSPYNPQEMNLEYSRDPDRREQIIRFLGVWDTVDAYGLPIDELTRAWDRVIWPLSAKDRNLSKRIKRACHALALDEQRQTFEPMLWNEDGQRLAEHIRDESLSQVWFSGVHSDVGGGYPDDSLSLVPLCWMLEQADQNGLQFVQAEWDRLRAAADLAGPQHDSRRAVGAFYRYQPRHLETLCNEQKPGFMNWVRSWFLSDVQMNEVKVLRPKIHHTVFDRIIGGGDAYAPINLPAGYAIVQHDGRILSAECSERLPNGTVQLAGGSRVTRGGKLYVQKGGKYQPSGKGGYTVPEDQNEATGRRQAQELVWNTVWLRRLVYGLTIAVTLLFLLFPTIDASKGQPSAIDIATAAQPWLGTWSAVFSALPEIMGNLPGLGFAQGFFESYANRPFVFTVFLLLIVALLGWSAYLRSAINNEMRLNFSHIGRTGTVPNNRFLALRDTLAKIRASKGYQFFGRRVPRITGELIAGTFFVAAVLVLLSRLSFIVLDGAGQICSPTAGELRSPKAGQQSAVFQPGNACFATGITLTEGQRYAIKLHVHPSPQWRDASIPADAYGWLEPPGWSPWVVPLRRHLFADWYQPIARIGATAYDRYPLEPPPVAQGDDRPPNDELHHTIKARRSGELFLYLNDAVFFTPTNRLLEFYTNNHGAATVTVEHVK